MRKKKRFFAANQWTIKRVVNAPVQKEDCKLHTHICYASAGQRDISGNGDSKSVRLRRRRRDKFAIARATWHARDIAQCRCIIEQCDGIYVNLRAPQRN